MVLGIFFSHPVKMFGCRRPAAIGSLLLVVGGMLSCLAPSLMWMYVLKGIIPGDVTVTRRLVVLLRRSLLVSVFCDVTSASLLTSHYSIVIAADNHRRPCHVECGSALYCTRAISLLPIYLGHLHYNAPLVVFCHQCLTCTDQTSCRTSLLIGYIGYI